MDSATIAIGVGAFILLLVASWCVAEGGEILGRVYDASFIGGLLIAWLNTAPETIFLLRALGGRNPSFAAGALSGSAIVVSTIAMGCCVYFGSIARRTKTIYLKDEVRKQCLALVLSTVMVVCMAFTGFNAWLGAVGFIEYALFLVYSLRHRKRLHHQIVPDSPRTVDVEEGRAKLPGARVLSRMDSFSSSNAPSSSSDNEEEVPLAKGWLYMCVGGVLILLCSNPFIRAVMHAATVMDASPVLLAFFLAPIASEAPEILESITLSRRGHSQTINIAVSNLVGGTFAKTTLLVGIYGVSGVMYGFVWEMPSFSVSIGMLGLCGAIAGGLFLVSQQQGMKTAMALVATFFLTAAVQTFVSQLSEHYVDTVVPVMAAHPRV